MRRPRKGQAFRPPTAADQNAIINAAEAWRKGAPAERRSRPLRPGLIHVKNLTGDDLPLGSVMRVGAPLLTAVDDESMWFEGLDVEHGGVTVAVIREPVNASGVVEAVLIGCCVALVNVGATWHRRARPTTEATVLTSGLFGPVEILTQPETTGEQLCLCSIGNAANRSVVAIVQSGGISAGAFSDGVLELGSGTVHLLPPDSTLASYAVNSEHDITAYNMNDAIEASSRILLTPSEDWLPLAEVASC